MNMWNFQNKIAKFYCLLANVMALYYTVIVSYKWWCERYQFEFWLHTFKDFDQLLSEPPDRGAGA